MDFFINWVLPIISIIVWYLVGLWSGIKIVTDMMDEDVFVVISRAYLRVLIDALIALEQEPK